jgi:hypothetical protein
MADKSSATVVISENEQERVRKLGIAFRDQLGSWLAGVTAGVRYTDDVARELASACFEAGIVAFLTSTHQLVGPEQPIEERCNELIAKLMIVLEAEVAS